MTETLSAGWYPDPADNKQMRYWDGSQWTGAAFPAAAMPTVGASPIEAIGSATAPATSGKTGNVAARTVVRVLLVLAAFMAIAFVVILTNLSGGELARNCADLVGSARYYSCADKRDALNLWAAITAIGAAVTLVVALVVKVSADRS